jgi:hypothetical protein
MLGTVDPDLSDNEFLRQMSYIKDYVKTAREEVGGTTQAPNSSKADWIARAKAKNPGMSGAAIEAEYLKKFGK